MKSRFAMSVKRVISGDLIMMNVVLGLKDIAPIEVYIGRDQARVE